MKTEIRLTLLSVSALVCALVLFLLVQPERHTPQVPDHAPAGQQTPASARRTAAPGPRVERVRREEETPVETRTSSAAPLRPGTVTLKVVDENDQPVAGLVGKVHWNQQTGKGSGPAPETFTTGNDGCCTVACPEGAFSAKVFADEGKWAQSEFPTFDPALTGEVLLRVYSRHTLLLSIRYADGEPYDGIVTMTHDEKASAHAKAGMAEIPGVAARDAWVMADTTRGGFKSLMHELKASQITSGQRIDVTLERSKTPTAVFMLNVPRAPGDGDPLGQVPYRVTRCDSGKVIETGRVKFTGTSGSRKVGPVEAGRYSVSAAFGSYAAKADFELPDSGTHTVELSWEAGGTVQAEIIRPDGTAINGALLRIKDSDWPTYPAQDRPGTQAVAGDDGVVVLDGLAPGKHSLFAEAKGFEPAPVEVEVTSGGTANVGRVPLQKATAKVTIQVLNAPQGKYSVIMSDPARFGLTYMADVGRNGRLVFDAVPGRKYLVVLFKGDGRSAAEREIDVAGRESDDIQVQFDLSEPRVMSVK